LEAQSRQRPRLKTAVVETIGQATLHDGAHRADARDGDIVELEVSRLHSDRNDPQYRALELIRVSVSRHELVERGVDRDVLEARLRRPPSGRIDTHRPAKLCSELADGDGDRRARGHIESADAPLRR